jgi:ParB/RepB/Spo0J family partition protein
MTDVATSAPASGGEYRVVPLSALSLRHGFNPRTTRDPERFAQTGRSVRESGVLHPILVTPDSSDDTYVVVAGEGRYLAAAEAGLLQVPVIVGEVDERTRGLELAMAENLGRENLDVVAEARGFAGLKQAGWSKKGIAEFFGVSQKRVTERLQILELPDELHPLIARGEIPPSAINLAKIHRGLPQIVTARVARTPAQPWTEPLTWQEVVADPVGALTTDYEGEDVCLPDDVYDAGDSYPIPRFTLSEKATKDLQALCKLLGVEPEQITVRFGREAIEQALPLNAAHPTRDGWHHIIVGQDVADQLAGDCVAAGLKQARADARHRKEGARSGMPEGSEPTGQQGDAMPSEEAIREQHRAERAEREERQRAAVAHNAELDRARAGTRAAHRQAITRKGYPAMSHERRIALANEIDATWADIDAQGRQATAAERTHIESLLSEIKADQASDRKKAMRRDTDSINRLFDGGTKSMSDRTFRPGDGSGNAYVDTLTDGPGDQFIKSKGCQEVADPQHRPQRWSTGAVELSFSGAGFGTKGTLLEGAGSPGAGSGGGWLPIPQVVPVQVTTLYAPLTVEAAFASATADGNTVRYMVEGLGGTIGSGVTNAAAGVAEGGVKPESTLSMSTLDEPVKKIATVVALSDEMAASHLTVECQWKRAGPARGTQPCVGRRPQRPARAQYAVRNLVMPHRGGTMVLDRLLAVLRRRGRDEHRDGSSGSNTRDDGSDGYEDGQTRPDDVMTSLPRDDDRSGLPGGAASSSSGGSGCSAGGSEGDNPNPEY